MTNIIEVCHIVHLQPETQPKPRALLALLEHHHPKNALITCYEGAECDLLAKFLARYGYNTLAFYENSSDNLSHFLEELKDNKDIFIICQNSMLDKMPLDNIRFLVNYDMPERPKTYEKITQFKNVAQGVKRTIVNLISEREFAYLSPIKIECQIDFKEEQLPSMDEVLTLASNRILKKLCTEAMEVELSQYEDLSKKMLDSKDILLPFSLLIKNYLSKKIPFTLSENKTYKKSFSHPKTENLNQDEQSKESMANSTARLYVNLGRRDGINDLASLAHFLSEHAKVDLGHFSGSGLLRDHSAHIDVDEEMAEKIITAINGMAKKQSGEDDSNSIVCQRAKFAQGPRFHPKPHHHRKSPPFRRKN